MRIIITGGAGFLGSNLSDLLINKGHEVVVMDSLITGSIENISHLFGNKNFKFIKYDVTEYLFEKGEVDWILHFASPASPIDYAELPIQTLKVGSMGTHKALGLCIKKKSNFLLASTSEIYGDPLENPQKESYFGNVNPIGPRGVYDEAKRFAEALTMAYHNVHGIDTRIARLFNTYGPRMRINDGRLVPTIISQALQNQPLSVFGDGSQTRSFIYVSDMMQGLYKLMINGDNDPFNIGNPHEMTVLEMTEMIIELTNSKSEIVFSPLPENDPLVRNPDITRAKSILGWEPKVKVEDGIKKTIEYFEKVLMDRK